MDKLRDGTALLALLASLVLLTACPGPLKDIKIVQKMESFLQEPVDITCKPKRLTRPAKTFRLAPGEVTVLELGVTQGYTGDFHVEPLACETEGKSFILCKHERQFSMPGLTTWNLDEVEVGYQLRPAGESCQEPFHQADPLLRMAGEWKTGCSPKTEVDGSQRNSIQVTLKVDGNTFNLLSREYSDTDCASEKHMVEVQGSLAIDEEQINYGFSDFGEVKASPAKALLTANSEEAVAELKSSYCGKTGSYVVNVPTELDLERTCIFPVGPFGLATTLETGGLVLINGHYESLQFDRVIK